jgi:hypothetical protein
LEHTKHTKHRRYVQFVPVFSSGDAGNKVLRTANVGDVCLLPVGAFSVLGDAVAAKKDLLGESEVRTFGGAGLLGGAESLLVANASRES